jgi:hypothetical protein
MLLWEWLRTHGVRLDVVLECELDPCEREIEWHCKISGFPVPNGIRPAVNITTYPDGPEALIETFAPDPGIAYRSAVAKLRGLSVNIIDNERDVTLTFPSDLTA